LLGLALYQRRQRLALALLATAFLVLNWNEAIVMGPYLAAHGLVAGRLSLVWLLSTAPIGAGLVVFALHYRQLRRAPQPATASGDAGL
jgi:hypothetical protein